VQAGDGAQPQPATKAPDGEGGGTTKGTHSSPGGHDPPQVGISLPSGSKSSRKHGTKVVVVVVVGSIVVVVVVVVVTVLGATVLVVVVVVASGFFSDGTQSSSRRMTSDARTPNWSFVKTSKPKFSLTLARL
jgi:hypothetical protein